MKKSLFLLIALIFMLPKTQIGMKKNIKKHYQQWKESSMRYERLPNTDDNTMHMLQWEPLTEALDDNQHITLIDENYKPKLIHDESNFKNVPKDVSIIILKLLDLKDFFALLKTDSIRYALCSEQIIQRFLLEERYKNDLPKNLYEYLTTFPIEGQAPNLDLNTLVITAANAGYTNDFHILLNTQHTLHFILEGQRAYAALSFAVITGQIGIIKQLISHEIVKGQFTREELKEIISLCDDDKTVIKLLKRRKTKDKMLHSIKFFVDMPC